MTQWLSFWNQETRRAQRSASIHHTSDADIWIPYGTRKVFVGDTVHCVAITAGELLYFGRLDAGRIAVDIEIDHKESLDVWAAAGTGFWHEEPIVVDDETVDHLVFLKADGTPCGFDRKESGVLTGHAFQGRASLRELAAGATALVALA